MRHPALLALPLFLALSACNEAGGPVPEQTSESKDITMHSPAPPGADPAMQSSLGPQAAVATATSGPSARIADECGADKAMVHLNSLPSSDVLAAVRTVIRHDRIRIINPGDVVTMDFRPDRLNIEIGTDGRIKAIRCG